MLFYQLLMPALKSKEYHSLHKEILYTALYPTKKYSDKNFNYLKSQLYSLVEVFITYQSFTADKTANDLHLLQSVQQRKLHKSYPSVYKKALNSLNDNQAHSLLQYAQRHQFYTIADSYQTATNSRNKNPFFAQAAASFDDYWVTHKLKYLCTMLSNEHFMQLSYDKTFLSELKDWLQQHPPSLPITQAYYYLLMILINEDNQANFFFEKLKSLIHSPAQQILPQDLKPIIQIAITYCGQQISLGQSKYVKEAMELYKFGVYNELLLTNNIISPWTYKNMVKLAINLKEYNWLEEFIHEYAQKLAPTNKEDAYHFSLADLYYAKGDYPRAQQHLNIVEFKDPLYYVGAKTLLIKIYYEEDSFDALESSLFAFKVYLKRNKLLSAPSKKPYENFIRFVGVLQKGNIKSIDNLKIKIDNSICTEKRWLNKQLEQF